MVMLPAPPEPKRAPVWASREVMVDFVRAHAPDLRIRKVRLEDGKRACFARFSVRGEVLEAEAIEAPDLPDPDDAIVRRCAWLIYRRLGIATRFDDGDRARLEREVLIARQRGDAEYSDKLGLELALMNESTAARVPLRTRFQR